MSATIHIGDCVAFLEEKVKNGDQYDCVVMDPPYEIGLHGSKWDETGVAFSDNLWSRLFQVLKPGAFILSFSALRLYHHLADAGERNGFKPYPFLTWKFSNGLPKPMNVSRMFDRDNGVEPPVVGAKKPTGVMKSNVLHGAQTRSVWEFPEYAEGGVSEEGKEWDGFYYGANCFKPTMEPIFLGQKPPEGRMLDNIRRYRTGALNLGALEERTGKWPTTIFEHPRAKKADHDSSHPSVKPLSLMRELCLVACPPGGHILDPFAGTGTTGEAAVVEGFDVTLVEQNPEMEPVIARRLGRAK